MQLSDYFDRIAIIHLPERQDRFESLSRELRHLGVDIAGPKVRIPEAPRPGDACGFPSRGVYGNFLSHLAILRQALDDGLRNIWVLEDDAIFSRRMCRSQGPLVERLRSVEWDLCYFGHSLSGRLIVDSPLGLAPAIDFWWAHCYAVHAKALPRLVTHLERCIERPTGHPEGGKLYIDAAFHLFRRFNPSVITLVANPVLSVQKGCASSLAGVQWYENAPLIRPLIAAARTMRDNWWKLTC